MRILLPAPFRHPAPTRAHLTGVRCGAPNLHLLPPVPVNPPCGRGRARREARGRSAAARQWWQRAQRRPGARADVLVRLVLVVRFCAAQVLALVRVSYWLGNLAGNGAVAVFIAILSWMFSSTINFSACR